ncbi:MAG: orotidine-5'-phosphate decarboxylase [Syntrophobacterales bacterium]|nr:MAG: orotidine-5'-phosphate decarboxylase [Syntrophobacterales bacterium]
MMEPRERLIFALDVERFGDAQKLAGLLKGHVGLFKVGKQLFTHAGPKVIDMIRNKGERIFLDLKFHDIPNTVAKAAEEATKLGSAMFTVHSMGGYEMMKRAVESSRNIAKHLNIPRPLILAVTILTSMDEVILEEVGIKTPLKQQVVRLATLAKRAGVNGVIASPREIRLIRDHCGAHFLIVTPGVRPASATKDDQKRTLTPGEAVRAGADYIVVGRPIKEADDPVKAADEIVEEIS